MRIRGDLTGETTLTGENDGTGDEHTRPHEELNPSGSDDVVLGEGRAQVGGADVVKLQRDDLTVADGFGHVDVFGHTRGAEGSSGDGRSAGSDDTSGGSNTTEHDDDDFFRKR